MIIGEGQGANWWCVLFPPLCFVEGEESLCLENDFAEILENSELEHKTINIKPSFKIVEIWQTAFGKD
jgi:stage II sporulation protein R